jgi:hypothetical protein
MTVQTALVTSEGADRATIIIHDHTSTGLAGNNAPLRPHYSASDWLAGDFSNGLHKASKFYVPDVQFPRKLRLTLEKNIFLYFENQIFIFFENRFFKKLFNSETFLKTRAFYGKILCTDYPQWRCHSPVV